MSKIAVTHEMVSAARRAFAEACRDENIEGPTPMRAAVEAAVALIPSSTICGDTTEGVSFHGEPPPTFLCRLPSNHTGSHRSVEGTYWHYLGEPR